MIRYTRLFPRLLPVLFCVVITSCGNKGSTEGNDETRNAGEPIHVSIQVVQPSNFENVIHLSGAVKAFDDVTISAEEGGVLKSWLKERGQAVQKDQPIAQLKDDILRAGYAAAEAQYKLSQLNYEKQDKVFREQGISELQIKGFEYGRDAAQAQADLMKTRLEHTTITSPIAGILEERYLDEGEFVPPGVPVARVVNIARLKVLAEIPETHAGGIRPGISVRMTFDALPGFEAAGKIIFAGKTLSATNKTLPVEIAVDNRSGRIRPEMIAKILLPVNGNRNALMIKESAILQVDRNKLVVYIENGGKAVEKVITTGGRQGSNVEVLSGLSAGDRLITRGQQKLVTGQPVEIVR